METSVFFRREFLSGEDYDRQVTEGRRVSEALQHIETGNVGKAKIENHAVERFFGNSFDGIGAGGNDGDVDVVVAEQFPDAELLTGIIFDNQQPLSAGRG